MPVQSGTSINIYQGETLPIEVTVYDSTGQLATNLTVAKFALKQGVAVIISDATIVGAVVSVAMDQATTLLLSGVYQYEFRVKDADGEVDSLVIGKLTVLAGPISIAL